MIQNSYEDLGVSCPVAAQSAAEIDVALSKDNRNREALQCTVVMLRAGHSGEWAAIAYQVIDMGETEVVARRVAGLIETGRPTLAAAALRALIQIASGRAVSCLRRLQQPEFGCMLCFARALQQLKG